MSRYANKSLPELQYIQKDAYEAAQCAKALGNYAAECRYLDEVNDASSEMYKRQQKGN